MSTTERPIPKNPERPIWPTYSWRAKSINARLLYIRDHRQADAAIVRLRKGPLGFDLEWRPNFIKGRPENPVALVQLSTEDTVLLIQIYVMESTEFSLISSSPEAEYAYIQNFRANFGSSLTTLTSLRLESAFNVNLAFPSHFIPR
jgi:hypothetical protein